MPSDSNAQLLAGVTAASLGLGRRIDLWGLALLLAAIAALAIPAGAPSFWRTGGLLVSVVAGMAQKYFSLRIDLDASLFARLADRASRQPAEWDVGALTALDKAMADCGLIKPTQDALRDMADRSRGAMRLLYLQGICLVVQLTALLSAVSGGLS